MQVLPCFGHPLALLAIDKWAVLLLRPRVVLAALSFKQVLAILSHANVCPVWTAQLDVSYLLHECLIIVHKMFFKSLKWIPL